MNSILSYLKYIDDVSESRDLMPRSLNTSTRTNQLRLEPFMTKINS